MLKVPIKIRDYNNIIMLVMAVLPRINPQGSYFFEVVKKGDLFGVIRYSEFTLGTVGSLKVVPPSIRSCQSL